MKIRSCRFECSSFGPQDEPRAPGPLIVFLGRSNVGKSSLINRLLGTKKLARTSSSPGRTQSVNFYRVNDSIFFVDLPGYGYARVPEEIRQSWKPMVEGFLDRFRERIRLAVLVVDARRGLTELDDTMRDWLRSRSLSELVVATKTDRTAAGERAQARGWGLLVSSRTGLGIRETWKHLDRALDSANDRG